MDLFIQIRITFHSSSGKCGGFTQALRRVQKTKTPVLPAPPPPRCSRSARCATWRPQRPQRPQSTLPAAQPASRGLRTPAPGLAVLALQDLSPEYRPPLQRVTDLGPQDEEPHLWLLRPGCASPTRVPAVLSRRWDPGRRSHGAGGSDQCSPHILFVLLPREPRFCPGQHCAQLQIPDTLSATSCHDTWVRPVTRRQASGQGPRRPALPQSQEPQAQLASAFRPFSVPLPA